MKSFLFCCFLLFLTGCGLKGSSVPPLSQGGAFDGSGCSAIFPQGTSIFVHSIDFRMNNGRGSTLLGITSLDGKSISSALLTLEGFTLFEAISSAEKGLLVQRAVPPFDTSGFAQGLMEDIRSIFQSPQGGVMVSGRGESGIPLCRYTYPDGRVTDILPERDDCWQRNEYSSSKVRTRTITAHSCKKVGVTTLPERLELEVPGSRGYTLKMKLIRVDN